jgi:hypothetical protein
MLVTNEVLKIVSAWSRFAACFAFLRTLAAYRSAAFRLRTTLDSMLSIFHSALMKVVILPTCLRRTVHNFPMHDRSRGSAVNAMPAIIPFPAGRCVALTMDWESLDKFDRESEG